MEKRIWKFTFEPTDNIEIEMPKNAEILTVQTQCEQSCIWALVNPKEEKEIRKFRLVGTGHIINDNLGKYIGTFQIMNGQLIFHLFEK